VTIDDAPARPADGRSVAARTAGATSPSVLRSMNAAEVLRVAWEHDVVTASDLIGATGLSRSTIIGVCDELLDRGWLRPLADARSTDAYRKGRPARRWTLAHDAGCVVGVDAGQHHVTVSVADLRGTPLGRAERRLDPDALGAERRSVVGLVVEEALAAAHATADRVLATVVGVPAPVDAHGASPAESASDFWQRVNPDYVGALHVGTSTVVVENDANLAALAEGAAPHGLGTTSSVTLLAGERFGAGFVLDGALVRGARGAAGEMRLLDLVEGVGSADGIGAVLRDWARDARAAGLVPRSSLLHDTPVGDLGAPVVLAAADAGDPTALELVERLAERLARIGTVLSSVLDVDRIIVAGAVAPSIGLLVERTSPRLAALSQREPPEVLASRLGEHVVVLGAVAHAVAHVREHALELTLPPGRTGGRDE